MALSDFHANRLAHLVALRERYLGLFYLRKTQGDAKGMAFQDLRIKNTDEEIANLRRIDALTHSLVPPYVAPELDGYTFTLVRQDKATGERMSINFTPAICNTMKVSEMEWERC